MDKFQPMISLADARAIVDRTLADVRLPSENVATRRAVGRILAEDQVSGLDLPPFDKSAMDGYAVPADDRRTEYRLVETVPAGAAGRARLEAGTAVKVMTGAPVPAGGVRVVMVEQTTERDGVVVVHSHSGPSNICRAGEDVRAGEIIREAGARLDAVDVGNLISCGLIEVPVVRPVRVGILSTGDEIVDSPEALGPGRIMNCNGPMLATLAGRFDMEVVAEESVADDLRATTAALASMLTAADMIVVTGGVSVGERDFVLEAMEAAGLTIHFCRVAVKPGRPTTYASGGGRAVLGLAGNPVSAFLMFHVLGLRVANVISGRVSSVRELVLPLAAAFKRRKTDRTQYVPARLTEECRLEAISYHGPAHLSALREADGFFAVPAGAAELTAGQGAAFLPTRRLLR